MTQPYWPELYSEQVGSQATLSNIGVGGKTLYTFKQLPAGLLDVAERRLIVKGNIAFSTTVLEIPVISLSFHFDDGTDILQLIYIASLAVSASQNDDPIRFQFDVVTETEGTSATFIGTGHMFVTNAGVTSAYNMLPDWLSADQLDATKALTPILNIAASTNLTSARIVELLLTVK